MNGIDIVTGNDILHNIFNELAVFRQSRVKIHFSVCISDKAFRVLIVDVVGRQFFIFGSSNAIRIQPCMEFHAARMRFFNHKLQRVPIRRRSLSGCTCKETAPRFQL